MPAYSILGRNAVLDETVTNKLYGSRHNMPPPLSSLCGHRSASRRRADRAADRN